METLFVADHVNRARASALAREIELRRSLADRGVTLHPEPPVRTLHCGGSRLACASRSCGAPG